MKTTIYKEVEVKTKKTVNLEENINWIRKIIKAYE